MDSYEDYNHGTHGLVILNEDGFDRLVLGEETPDPHVGKRIAPSSVSSSMIAPGSSEEGLACLAERTAITSLWASIQVAARPFP